MKDILGKLKGDAYEQAFNNITDAIYPDDNWISPKWKRFPGIFRGQISIGTFCVCAD
jgi:hypothetical protein